MHVGRAIGNVAAFFCGLVAVAAAIHRAAPAPRVPEYTDKRAWFAQHRDEIDTVFLGSSRVRRQIDPKLFDATTAALGAPTHSFNFGLDGMGHPEQPYIIDELLALRPHGLKNVVVELTRFAREFNERNPADSLRALHWHTYHYTAIICAAVWRDPDHTPLSDRLIATWQHLIDCARWEWNVGGISAWRNSGAISPTALGPGGNGFFPVPDRFPVEKRPAYQKQIQEMLARRGSEPPRDPLFEEVTASMLAKLHAHGVRTFVVVMPRIFPQPPWNPPGETLLRFDDPVQDAAFFDPAMRYDAQHLNSDGAALFSRELAERFVKAERLKE
jgi:hypothetical protein